MGILGGMLDFRRNVKPTVIGGGHDELDMFDFAPAQRFAIVGHHAISVPELQKRLAGLGGVVDIFPEPEGYLEAAISVPAGHYHAVFIMRQDVVGAYFGASYLNRATLRLSPSTRVFEVFNLLKSDESATTFGFFEGLDASGEPGGPERMHTERRYAELSRRPRSSRRDSTTGIEAPKLQAVR